MPSRAIRLVVRDPDLHRSRLTAGFRFFLAIPHLIWLIGWFSLAVWPVVICNWIALLFSGKPSPMLHRFLSSYVRYVTHVASYVSLAADPYPGFGGRPGSYPIDVEIDDPQPQSRWVTFFRLFLALPAILLADTMLGIGTSFSGGWATQVGGVVASLAFLGYFVCIARGRMPHGFRDLLAYCIGYSAQVSGYLFLLTDRYPNSDPSFYESANVYRNDPIRLTVEDDLRRSRLTTFFRLPLLVPHLVFATLFRGRSPAALHRFLAAYLRYTTHVVAFATLVGNPFPGFVGRAGTYPIDLEIAGPERQRRLVTGFRWFLSLPANLIASGLTSVIVLTAIYSWFHALVRGRLPRGLRNLGAFAIRYNAQLYGYTYLLTASYPYTGPTAGAQLSLEAAEPAAT
jgi:hypothetical protein